MSSVIIVAGFAFFMAIIFAVIGVRAAKVRSDRLAFWNSARNWPSVSGKLLEVGIDVITKRRNVEDRLLVRYLLQTADRLFLFGRRPSVTREQGSIARKVWRHPNAHTRADIKIQPRRFRDIAYDPDDPDNSVLARGNKPVEAGEGVLSIYLGFFPLFSWWRWAFVF